MKGDKMDKKTINWDGVMDTDVLKGMKCRVWSKKEFPLTWSGEKINIINYNNETGIVSAHIGAGTYVFHISSVIISVQEKKDDDTADGYSSTNDDPEANAARMRKSKRRKRNK